jgi:hypothetical protein
MRVRFPPHPLKKRRKKTRNKIPLHSTTLVSSSILGRERESHPNHKAERKYAYHLSDTKPGTDRSRDTEGSQFKLKLTELISYMSYVVNLVDSRLNGIKSFDPSTRHSTPLRKQIRPSPYYEKITEKSYNSPTRHDSL